MTEALSARSWDKAFLGDYRLQELPQPTWRYLNQLSARLDGATALDNGCGNGRIKRYLEQLGWQCYGTDTSYEALRQAKTRTPRNLFRAAADNLPFSASFFDLIILWRVLHNLPFAARSNALQEAYRVLKPGGTIVCLVQAKEDADTLALYQKIGEPHPEETDTHILTGDYGLPYQRHFYSQDEITKQFNDSGFRPVSVILFAEHSGANALKNRKQLYWRVEAVRG